MINRNAVIGEKIRKAREQARLSQAELGSQLGYSQNTVAGWESGKRGCRLETLESLALLLKRPLSDFLGSVAQVAEPGQLYGQSLKAATASSLVSTLELEVQRLQFSIHVLTGVIDRLKEDATYNFEIEE